MAGESGHLCFLNGADRDHDIEYVTINASLGGAKDPVDLAKGDFNGDGKLDVAAVALTSQDLTVLIGDGSGNLGVSDTRSLGAGGLSIEPGDVNEDGFIDLVVGLSSGQARVYWGNGTGQFPTNANLGSVGGKDVAVADLDWNGHLDIAAVDQSGGTVSILLGDGAGGLVAAGSLSTSNTPKAIASGDLNHDGRLDLAVVNDNGSSRVVDIFLGTGAGAFAATNSLSFSGSILGEHSVVMALIDHDSFLDIAVTDVSGGSNRVGVYLGNGDGSFSNGAAPHEIAFQSTPVGLLAADVNRDGRLDLAATTTGGNVVVRRGNGFNEFGIGDAVLPAVTPSFGTGASPVALVAGDFNEDGRLDLATANTGGKNVSLLLSTAGTTGPGVPAQLAFFPAPSASERAGKLWAQFFIEIQDAYGRRVTTATNTVTILRGLGTDAIQGTKSKPASGGLVGFSNGVGQDLSYDTAETITVTAQSGGLTQTDERVISIVGTPAELVFGTHPAQSEPVDATWGAFTVEIQDANGNVVTTATNTVTIVLDGNETGTLTGDVVNKPAVNGVATFDDLAYDAIEDLTFDIVDDFGQAQAIAQQRVAVLGPADRVVFGVTPRSVEVKDEVWKAFTVRLEDNAGHLLENETATVTVSVVEGGGLGGTTISSATKGIAAFTDIARSATGSITVKIESGSLTAATRTVAVVGQPAQLVFGTAPRDAEKAGTTWQDFTVRLEDAWGNLVPTRTKPAVDIVLYSGSETIQGSISRKAIGGIARFDDLSYELAEAISFYAQSGAPMSSTRAMTIVPGDPEVLAFVQQPTDAAVDAAIAPAVKIEVRDAVGNAIGLGRFETRMLLIDPGSTGAMLAGPVSQFIVDGVATYTGLKVDTVGEYELMAEADLDGDSFREVTALSVAFEIGGGATGAGTLAAELDIDVGEGQVDIAVADVNKDGLLDGVVARAGGVDVFMNKYRLSVGDPLLTVAAGATGTTSLVMPQPTSPVGDLRVQIHSLIHSEVASVTLSLKGPDGTTRALWDGSSTSGANLSHTVFRDNATSSPSEGTAPYTGEFQPVETLSAGGDFKDQNSTGTWTLLVDNTAATDDAVLKDWSLTIETIEPVAGTFDSPQAVTTGDFDRDGDVDIVVADMTTGGSIAMVRTELGDSDAFLLQSFYLVGATPTALTAADLNRDGMLDVVVVNQGDEDVTVLLGDGAGAFEEADTDSDQFAGPPIVVGVVPTAVAVEDLVGPIVGGAPTGRDGIPDLVITNQEDETVSIIVGDGAGGFAVAPTPLGAAEGVGLKPTDVAMGDADRDGSPDIVVLNQGSGGSGSSLSILLGDGSGSFGAEHGSPVLDDGTLGPGPTALGAADMKGNGFLDLVLTSPDATNGDRVVLVSGNGFGGVVATEGLALPSGATPVALALADVRRTGRPDVVTANSAIATFSVLENTTPKHAVEYEVFQQAPVLGAPSAAVAGDLNRDGSLDLAVANKSDDSVTILIGSGNGTFPVNTGSSGVAISGIDTPVDLDAVDLNRDGKADLVVALDDAAAVAVLIGNGDGTFSVDPDIDGDGAKDSPVAVGSSTSRPSSLAQGDFDRDGVPDIAVALRADDAVAILRGLGDGRLDADADGDGASDSPMTVGSEPRAVVVVDLNLDGCQDLVVANTGGHDLTIMRGNGDGTFATNPDFDGGGADSPIGLGAAPRALTVGDFDQDGYPDIAVAEISGSNVLVLFNEGTGVLSPPVAPIAVGSIPVALTAVDIDRDGDLDLAVANQASNDVSVLINTNGVFTELGGTATPKRFGVSVSPNDIVFGDFSREGRLDLVTVDGSADEISVLISRDP
ncbi:FG-GAP-like repeat-containing protein [Planctomycetota bacterium]